MRPGPSIELTAVPRPPLAPRPSLRLQSAIATQPYLTSSEAEAINRQVAALEARTGVQVVTAITGKSDSYTELPWKAFALGASVAGLALVALDAWRPEWATATTALLHTTFILACAGACAALVIVAPPFARLFLRPSRRDVEVRQYAQAMFLNRGLFGTRRRTAILILVSLFERRIEILTDVGVQERVTDAEWQAVIGRMTPHLRERRPFHALQEGMAAAADLLTARGFTPSPDTDNELPDRPIEERGA